MNRYPKPSILCDLPTQGHAIIEASAGTGKTFTLEHLIVDLLLRHPEVELENILIVTFTERATAELKVRVRNLLGRVIGAARHGDGEPDHQQDLIGDVSTVDGEAPHWVIGEADRRKLERAYFSFDLAPIYTIHGFCQRVLTEYAFANRRFFDQKHVEFGPLFEQAFTDAMRRTLACNDATRDWLEAWLESGSVEELQGMLAKTLNARVELWPRYDDDRLDRGLERFGEDFWRHYRNLYTRGCRNREKAFMAAQQDWKQHRSAARFLMLVDDEVNGLKHSLRSIRPQTEEERDFLDLVGALSRFKPAVVQKFLPLMRQAIAREKRRSGSYTYEDMLTMVWEGLQRPVTGEWLVDALRRRYRFALIDEFQDTDEIQWNIFRRLFVPEEPTGHRLFIIGDPKQAIYGFRNADVYTYLEACHELLALNPDHVEGVHHNADLAEELGESPDAQQETSDDAAGEHEDEEPTLAASGIWEEDEPRAVKLHLQQNWRSRRNSSTPTTTSSIKRPRRPSLPGRTSSTTTPCAAATPACAPLMRAARRSPRWCWER